MEKCRYGMDNFPSREKEKPGRMPPALVKRLPALVKIGNFQ